MIMRGLDSSDDWKFGRGVQSYKTDLDALKQSILTRLRQWKGDCFFASDEGVDYNNYLDIGTKTYLDLDIKRVVLQTGGVLRMTAFTSTLDTTERALSIDCTIETVYGELNLVEAI